jgi:hypothetical protein
MVKIFAQFFNFISGMNVNDLFEVSLGSGDRRFDQLGDRLGDPFGEKNRPQNAKDDSEQTSEKEVQTGL